MAQSLAQDSYGEEIQRDNLDHLKNAKNMLASLKKATRVESQAGFRGAQGNDRPNISLTLDDSTDLLKSNPKEFKLATKMSKEMRKSNNSVTKVLNTLNQTGIFGGIKAQIAAGQDAGSGALE